MLETLADTRSMFDSDEFGIEIYDSAGVLYVGIKDHNFDQSLQVNGRRTGIRLVNEDAALIAVDSVITEKLTDTEYTIRAREQGARTTLFILEQI